MKQLETGSGEGSLERLPVIERFFTRRVGAMLVRNTVVSTAVFILGLGVMWLLVEWAQLDSVVSAGISFLFANTLHYTFGRTWIFRGTDRSVASGYFYFLVNAAIGLAITVALFAAIIRVTDIHYLAVRAVVSVFAGLAMFALNATLNFRQV